MTPAGRCDRARVRLPWRAQVWGRACWLPLLLILAALGPLAPGQAPAARAALPAIVRPAAQQTAGQAGLVGEGFRAIYTGYFNPVDPAALLDAAWQAASDAARRAGNAALPPRPELAGEATTAYSHFATAYTMLEAATRLEPTELAYAAIRGMVGLIDNCHTYFLTPTQAEAQRVASRGGVLTGLGFRRTFTPAPWTVTYVVPDSPAESAGLHPGDAILAYDGDSSDTAPATRSAKAVGSPVVLTIRRPGEAGPRPLSISVGRYQFPQLETQIVASDIGYLRFFVWEDGGAQAEVIRAAIADFEQKGVRGWVVDLRANGGGYPGAIARLFATAGVIYRQYARPENVYTLNADDSAILPRRPLVFLVGPGSGSASEIVPEALREAGDALLVGDHTQGCMAGTTEHRLSDGSAIWVTSDHVLVGISGRDFEGIGVDPDVHTPQTAADLAAGRDPGLDAAVAALQAIVGEPAPATVP